MNNFKKIGFAASLLLASGFASATTHAHELGDITYSSVVNAINTIDMTSNDVAPGVFNDEFNFSITADNVFNVLVNGSKASIPEFTSIYLSNGTTGTVFDITTIFSGASIVNASLSAGSYTLFVNGLANPSTINDPNNYSLSASISPVPEPSSIALMLGGLGLVGFMAARRRKQNA